MKYLSNQELLKTNDLQCGCCGNHSVSRASSSLTISSLISSSISTPCQYTPKLIWALQFQIGLNSYLEKSKRTDFINLTSSMTVYKCRILILTFEYRWLTEELYIYNRIKTIGVLHNVIIIYYLL